MIGVWLALYKGHKNRNEISGYTLVDKNWYATLNQWVWHIIDQFGNLYVYRWEGARGVQYRIYMVDVVSPLTEGTYYNDHRNLDTLDNRKENLRPATMGQNSCNRKAYGKTSKYKGVEKSGRQWRAKITHGGVSENLGFFKAEEEAALAYNEAAKKYHGEFAYLNQVEGMQEVKI